MIFAAALALALSTDLPATNDTPAPPPAATTAPAAAPPPAPAATPGPKLVAPAGTSPEQLFQQALAAQKASDWPRYRDLLEQTVNSLHDPSRLWYRLATARLLAGDRPGALAALARMVDAGVDRDPRPDPVFAPLLGDPAFEAEVARMLTLREPVARATEAFRLDRGDLIEGIAHDPVSGTVFLSSVRERRILRRGRSGEPTEFVASGELGLRAALGIAVDRERRLLWIVSSGLPQAAGLPADQLQRSSLLALHIDRGTVEKRIDAPAGALWNDLELAPDGVVYASDPAGRAIHRIGKDGSVTTLVQDQGLRSPGGLALSADGTVLYVADWTVGLAAVELRSGRLRWLDSPADTTTVGIDGLRRRGDTLIAIQNGVHPPRIQRFVLAPGGRSIQRAETLERARPDWDEPTLGAILGDELWYVSNSQWPKLDEKGALLPGAAFEPTVILSLPLGPAQ